MAEARALKRRTERFLSAVRRVFDEESLARQRVSDAYEQLSERTLRDELEEAPLDRLKGASGERARAAPAARR